MFKEMFIVQREDDNKLEEQSSFLQHDLEGSQKVDRHCNNCDRRQRQRFQSKLTLAVAIIFTVLVFCDVILRWQTYRASTQQITVTGTQDNVEEEPESGTVVTSSPLPQSSYVVGNGLSSELPALVSVVNYVPQNYTGILTYDPELRKLIRTPDGPVTYFGRPSAKLDDTWENLLENEFPILFDDEIKPEHNLEEKDIWPGHKYRFEPDVFHNLHCLNAIRKHVNLVLYPDIPMSEEDQKQAKWDKENVSEDWMVMHIEHCMDRVRQSLMCHPDLTPSPLHMWADKFPVALGTTGERICREWKPIRQWMSQRWEEGEKVVMEQQKNEEEKKRKAEEDRKSQEEKSKIQRH